MNAVITYQDGRTAQVPPQVITAGTETCITIPRFALLDETIESVELDTGIFEGLY